MSIIKLFKSSILSIPLFKKIYLKRRLEDGVLISKSDLNELIESAEPVLLDLQLDFIKVGLVRDNLIEGFEKLRSYHPKYERFLKKNNIKYEYYDVLQSDWMEKAKDFDVIIWHTKSDPVTQDIATNKIYVLEKLMGKKCLPSFDEIWTYENKINAHYLYKNFGLPEIPTFVTHSYKEAIKYINEVKYPIISKISTGSSSYGVEKIVSQRHAKKFVDGAFSFKGLKTYFPFQRQKNYVYFQNFMEDATFDLRIMVIGDKLMGYYRYPNKGDFKASGAGNYEKKELPTEAMDLAFKVKSLYQTTFLATDFLYSEKLKQYFIIESSIFIGVDSPEQLKVNDLAGYYQRISEGEYIFKQGKFWPQELTLKYFFENRNFNSVTD